MAWPTKSVANPTGENARVAEMSSALGSLSVLKHVGSRTEMRHSVDIFSFSRYLEGMAEREGFEPSIRFCRILTFQASAFDHSATAPHALEAGDLVAYGAGGNPRKPRRASIDTARRDSTRVMRRAQGKAHAPTITPRSASHGPDSGTGR